MELIITHRQERELDARVAEKVMRQKVVWTDQRPTIVADGQTPENVPHYSTNLGAAMTVALQLRRLGFVIDILLDGRGASITVLDAQGDEVCRFDNIISRFAQHMCQAALIAVGEEKRQPAPRQARRSL